jgi:MFS family permease
VTPRKTSLGVVFLVLFLDLVSFGMLFPLFAGIFHQYAQGDSLLLKPVLAAIEAIRPAGSDHPTQTVALFGGVMAALYAGLQFIAAPLWGRLSDRIGRRPVLLLSVAGSCLANLLWVFSSSFALFVLSRALAGGLSGNVGVANAAVADITTPETRGRGLAVVGIAFGVGFIIGPAIGGFSSLEALRIDHLGIPGLHPFSTPALVATVLGLVNLVWAWRSFAETLPPERRALAGPATRPLDPTQIVARELGPQVVGINLACLFHTLLFSGLEATLVFLTLEELGYQPADNAWLFVTMGVVSLLANGVVFRRLVGRLGARPLVLAGFAALIPGYVLVGMVDWWPSVWLLYLGGMVLSLGTGTVFPGLNTLASLAADPARQGWAMGTFRSAAALGRAVGPLLGAVVYFSWRPGATYLVCAAGVLLPALLVWRLARTEPASAR